MGSSNKTISYTIDIGADITRARQAAEQLQATFKKSFGEGSNKGMFNLFSGLEKALDTLERKGSQKITSIADAKALEKAKQDVTDYFAAIEREGKKIGNLGGADFKKRLEGLGTQLVNSTKAWKTFEDAQKSANKEAEKQSSNIQKKIDDNKKLIQSMREVKAAQDVLNQELTSSKERVTAARDRVARANMSSNFEKSQLGYANAYAAKKEQDYQDFLTKNGMTGKEKNDRISLQTSYQFITTDEISKAKKLLNYVTQIESAISKEEKKKIGEKDFTEITRLKAERERAKQEADDYLKQHNMSRNAVGKLDEIAIGSHNAEVEKKVNETIAAADGLKKVSDEAAKSAEEAQKRYTEAQKEVVEAQKEVTAAQKDVDTKQATYDNQTKQLKSFSDELKKNREEINQSRQSLRQFIDTSAKSNFDKLKEALRGIFGDEFVADMENSEEGLAKLKEKLDAVGDEKMNEARARIKEFLDAFKESESAGKSVKELGDKVNKASQDVQQLTDRQREVENFVSRFKYFFSLTNGFMLLKRSIKDAINTIKELDAVMTQTAVVSENTVGDMWKTLPQYSKEARKLGAAIKDVYSAQTLYVQQGLDMDSAMQLGVETLKMARVAGIDAAAATDTMTAALRGFKMELNETSAVRINDVYSKLAQNTASNVQEISTAMTKVAALANSANMSFENTAAFLAKIIESTREGAETAGTALKTVIARFTEVKKLYSEGELTGTDEEGQEVDVNKISAALRTAGINMNAFFTGARGLDEIFIELGSKWDSLTTVQQRYIATMAAGSRQQSRFLALMQDFSRTTELTGMAYNSAGSGQEQFEKTLESLESKLNKLKDAWQTFIMGIANSDVVKGLIDTGTKILETINGIVNAISGNNGLVKSILSVATAFGVFKVGGTLFRSGFGKIGTLIGIKEGAAAGRSFTQTFQATITKTTAGIKNVGTKLGKTFSGAFSSFKIEEPQYDFKGLEETLTGEGWMGKFEAENSRVSDAFKQWKNDCNEFGTSSKQAQASLKNLKTEYQAAGGNLKEFDKDLKTNTTNLEKTKVNMSGLASTAGVVGGALLFLSGIISQLGGAGKTIGEVLKILGASLLAFSIACKVAEAAAAAFGVTLHASLGIIGLVAAAVTGLILLFTKLRGESEEEKMQRLAKETESAKEAAQKAKEAYDNLFSSKNKYDELTEKLKTLTIGTKEYRDVLLEVNQLTRELATKYPGLKLNYNTKTGQLEIDTGSYNQVMEQEGRQLQINQSMASASQLVEDKNDIDKIISDTRERIFNLSSQYSGILNISDDKELYALGNLSEKDLQDILNKAKEEVIGEKNLSSATDDEREQIVKLFNEALEQRIKESIPENFQTDYSVQELVFQISDNSNTSRALSSLYDTDAIDTTDWNKDSYVRENWAEIINRALEAGYITEVEAKKYSDYTGENEAHVISKITGEDYDTVWEKSWPELHNTLRNFLNVTGLLKDLKLKTEEFNKLPQDIQEAVTTALIDVNNLTGTQVDLLSDFINKNGSSEGLKGLIVQKLIPLMGNFDGMEGIDFNKKYQTRSSNKMFKTLDNYSEKLSNSYLTLFNSVADSEKFTEEQKKTILSIINDTDIKSTKDLFKIIGTLREMGIDLLSLDDNVVNSLTDWINLLIKSGVAVKKWTNETATQTIKDIRGLANEAAEKQDRVFTKEQFQIIKTALEESGNYKLLDQFIEQTDDSYKFVGKDLQSIIKVLYNIADSIPSEVEQEKNAELNISSQLHHAEGDLTREDAEKLSKEEQVNFYKNATKNIEPSDLIAAGLFDPEKVDENNISQIWEQFLRVYFDKDIIEQEIQEGLEKAGLIGATNIELANASLGIKVTEDVYGEKISNKEAYNESNQQLANLALDTAIEEEGLTEVVERNNELFKINGKVQKDVAQALKVNALEAKKAEKNFDDLTSVIKDNNDAMKSKDPLTRQKAFDAIAKSARKAFNNENITSEFVENNQKAFENFANGVEGSEREIRLALSQAQLGAEKAEQAMSYLDQADFSIDGTADFSSIFAELAKLMGSAEDARAYLESLGYSVTWVVDGKIVDDVTGMELTDYTTIVTNSAGQAVNRNRTAGGGGGGGGKKEFKNDFDKYYNMVEDINELERLRNLLETDYQQLLESEAASGKAIYDNLKEQIDLLKERRDITADLAEKRKQQIIDTVNENKDLQKYAWWNDSDQTIEINWDLINQIKNSEEGDKVKDYVSKLEDFQSKYDEQVEALNEIESTLQEIEKRGREQYTSLEDRVRDALIKQVQDKIDELTASNEGINTANQNLLQSIQDTLDKQRQERDNEKTEKELSDKEQRLAYLRQDSSGANALEIAKLEQELADARESYTDQLIDQKISELQKQNDEAAEQRQEQIDLMQQSLEWQEKNGEFWDQAYALMANSIDEQGRLVHGSELEKLLKAGEAWNSLSDEGQMNWLRDLEKMVAEATGYLSMTRQLETIGGLTGQRITFTNAEGKTLTGVVDKNGNVVVTDKNGNTITYKNVYQDYDKNYRTLETSKDAKVEKKPATGDAGGAGGAGGTGGNKDDDDVYSYNVVTNNGEATIQKVKGSGGKYGTREEAEDVVASMNRWAVGKRTRPIPGDPENEIVVAYVKDAGVGNGKIKSYIQQLVDEFNKAPQTMKFATGGLADYTGPAWLDGTPSKPELVLNARDTENFIQLKDHLATLRQMSTNGLLGAGGDNYYDIKVQVDSLGSDYDVDMAIDRIKARIYQDGAYRNVNTLNRLR